jgi:hypothetical protein
VRCSTPAKPPCAAVPQHLLSRDRPLPQAQQQLRCRQMGCWHAEGPLAQGLPPAWPGCLLRLLLRAVCPGQLSALLETWVAVEGRQPD